MKTIYLTKNKDFKVEIDNLNHTLCRFTPGGEVIKTGKYKGELTKDSWKVVGYYPNLEQAVEKTLRLLFIDGLPDELDLNKPLGEFKEACQQALAKVELCQK